MLVLVSDWGLQLGDVVKELLMGCPQLAWLTATAVAVAVGLIT